ncbi:hypothetical protein OUZ56_007731 [Daphnia magna]|uniref:Fucosyltransferase n=1 Tax=Daphnia magna TaxID=35525 RepID=A0ABR0AAV4_9CRUS|nr:hypothetical protein OUZ56_007731 [Daphnia magna]
MLNIPRRQNALIMIGFVLVVGQCYFVLQRHNVRQLAVVKMFLTHPPNYPKYRDEEIFNIVTKRDLRPKTSTPTSTGEYYELMERYAQDVLPDTDAPFKRILFWNEAYGNKEYGVGHGRNALRESGCPVWQCETSDNRTNVQEYDAVVFHLRSWTQNDLPDKRSPHQRYVFWSIESAAWRFIDTNLMKNFFNWTMTYRWDSDIVSPYGYIKPSGGVPLHPTHEQMKNFLSSPSPINYAEGKTKIAAWFVSNCASQSRRNEMVRELQKYIDVDIYGDCGTMVCPRKREDDCRKMAGKKYKFYLSLENSLCQDYVTEKFFGMMHEPIIPVVVGFHDHHEKIAPRHSFINVANFEHIKNLADYMIFLDKNDTLYNEYFWWKSHFEVRNSQQDFNKGMCHLCSALHDKTLSPKIYKDMNEWWDKNATCQTPEIL